MRFNKVLMLFFWLGWLCVAQAAPTATVYNLRVSILLHRARLVFELSHLPKYHAFVLLDPYRVVLDLEYGRLAKPLIQPAKLDYIVKDLRVAQHGRMLRMVLELRHPAHYHIFELKAEGRQPNRLVVDLIADGVQVSTPKPQVVMKTPRPQKLRNVIVVIDPGHGGKDPGATGLYGTHEKNVVLAIGKDLQKLLDKQYGFTAKLTRRGDYFIPLRGRLAIERRDHADMFVAIHADAYKDRTSRGASVFALSEHGATSEAARWLAQQENQSELGNTLANLPYKNRTLRSVLINLAQTASISTSLGIGDDMIHELAKVTLLHHGFVEQAAFMVLKEPDVPSLLVETGFISNPKEELQLRSPNYQQKIARALMLGIRDYYLGHPPPGTFLAARKFNAH